MNLCCVCQCAKERLKGGDQRYQLDLWPSLFPSHPAPPLDWSYNRSVVCTWLIPRSLTVCTQGLKADYNIIKKDSHIIPIRSLFILNPRLNWTPETAYLALCFQLPRKKLGLCCTFYVLGMRERMRHAAWARCPFRHYCFTPRPGTIAPPLPFPQLVSFYARSEAEHPCSQSNTAGGGMHQAGLHQANA